MSIEEINEAIDKEIEFIGCANPESVKGMLRIKSVLNGIEYTIPNKLSDKRRYKPRICNVCGKSFTPHSGRAQKCIKCREAI